MKTRTFLILMGILVIAVMAAPRPNQDQQEVHIDPPIGGKIVSSQTPGTAILMSDDPQDLVFAKLYGYPAAIGRDTIFFSGGGIYADSYPKEFFDPKWIPQPVDSTISYNDRYGNLLGSYHVADTGNLPIQIQVYLKPAELPKNCVYSEGTTTKLIDAGKMYFLEIYDSDGSWNRGCDAN